MSLQAQPVWIDFADGSVSFWKERFARPGIVVATGGPLLAGEARAAGAATVHWDMYLRKRVGTPSEPADPALMERRADSLFDYAVSVTGCQTPLITLNEMWGASLPTPLTPTSERYRANVLRFVTRLAERGGRPALLLSSEPFTGGDAAVWWRELGKVSDLVLENYANANVIWRDGAVDGSRRLRVSYRRSAAKLLAVGVPSSRLGLMIGFQTGAGCGRARGVEAAFPLVRRREVAGIRRAPGRARASALTRLVLGLGAAERALERSRQDVRGVRVAVGARRRPLRRAGRARRELDEDRRAGQIDLAAGVRCVYGRIALTASNVASLARLTGDRELALTALVVRAIEREHADVSPSAVLAAERRIIRARYGGSTSAYRAAASRVGASPAVARAIVGDELRRREIVHRLDGGRISSADVSRFRATYAAVLARQVTVSPAPDWLPEGTGVALATSAPEAVFRLRTGRSARIRTAQGTLTVRALGDTTALGALSLELARPAVRRELRAARRADAYAAWTIRVQKAAESRMVCERDRLPELGVVSLASFAPFLSLQEPAAATPPLLSGG